MADTDIKPPSGSVLITGPTGGLGSRLLEAVATRRPEHLILVGRQRKALDDAARDARANGAYDVSVVPADLADLTEVADAGRAVRALVAGGAPPLSALILNAGLQMTDRRHASAQGLEMTFAVNVVAQHLLLRATLPDARTGAHAVLVGSGTHYGDWHSYGMVPSPDWQDPDALARPDAPGGLKDSKAGPLAYATSKLAVVHLAHAWQARQGVQMRVNVFDPGLMPGTGLIRGASGAQLWAWNRVMPAFTFLPGWSTPKRSAGHLADLALGAAHPTLAGGYVEVGKTRRSSEQSYSPDREQRLWTVLEQLVAPYAAVAPP